MSPGYAHHADHLAGGILQWHLGREVPLHGAGWIRRGPLAVEDRIPSLNDGLIFRMYTFCYFAREKIEHRLADNLVMMLNAMDLKVRRILQHQTAFAVLDIDAVRERVDDGA